MLKVMAEFIVYKNKYNYVKIDVRTLVNGLAFAYVMD